MNRRSDSGFTLLEALTTVAVVGLLAAMAIPWFTRMLARARVRAAAAAAAHLLGDTRQRAITLGRGTALSFTFDGTTERWHYRVFEDGDGDGVRNDDIRDRIDLAVTPPADVLPSRGMGSIGFGRGVVDPDTGLPFPPHAKAVAFGSTGLCAFSPSGDGTPGSLYVTAGGEIAVVRSSGEHGSIRIIWFDRWAGRWIR